MMTSSHIEYEESSGNVFADLGLKDAEELHARGLIGLHVLDLLEERGLHKQKEIGDFLNLKQPEVSKLMNGDFTRFSEGRLMGFLRKLDQKVLIQISPHKAGEPYQQVAYATPVSLYDRPLDAS
jgi:predicted XRE-type DNA-binding protein